ncbi:hypothetical protein MBLNU457_1550t1 [Dothideomycetes sp. NU457]
MTDIPSNIILYHYNASPYARRISAYLALRKIPYAECIQAPTLPRPDLTTLGVNYRRIPVLAHGRDIYADTRLILSRLQDLIPASSTHPALPTNALEPALAALLDIFTVDGGVFARAAQLLPINSPALQNPKFRKDREDFSGRSWDLKDMERGQPEAIVHMRRAFDTFEALLSDGREWIAGTDGLGLADINSAWVLEWMMDFVKVEVLGKEVYPRTYAWVARYKAAVKAAVKANKVVKVKGDVARKFVLGAQVNGSVGVDEKDPLKLKKGQDVVVFPIDTGFKHKDTGKLVALNKEEVVIAVKAPEGSGQVHLHAPRWGFRVLPAGGAKL